MVAPALWPCSTWELSVGLGWFNLATSQADSMGFRVVLQPEPHQVYTAVLDIDKCQCLHPVSDPVSAAGYFPAEQATPFALLQLGANSPWPLGTMWLGINVHWAVDNAGNPYLTCGLQLASFWSANGALIAQTGIQYPVAFRQDFPSEFIDYYSGNYGYFPWSGNWNGFGWTPWDGSPTMPAEWLIYCNSKPQAPPVLANPNGNYNGSTLYPAATNWLGGIQPYAPPWNRNSAYDDDLTWTASVWQSPIDTRLAQPFGWQAVTGCTQAQSQPAAWAAGESLAYTPVTFDPQPPAYNPPGSPPWFTQQHYELLDRSGYPTGQAYLFGNDVPTHQVPMGIPLGLGVYCNYLGARWLTENSAL